MKSKPIIPNTNPMKLALLLIEPASELSGDDAVFVAVSFELPDEGVLAGGGADAGALAPNKSLGNSTLSTW